MSDPTGCRLPPGRDTAQTKQRVGVGQERQDTPARGGRQCACSASRSRFAGVIASTETSRGDDPSVTDYPLRGNRPLVGCANGLRLTLSGPGAILAAYSCN